jgi:hypothetical protein
LPVGRHPVRRVDLSSSVRRRKRRYWLYDVHDNGHGHVEIDTAFHDSAHHSSVNTQRRAARNATGRWSVEMLQKTKLISELSVLVALIRCGGGPQSAVTLPPSSPTPATRPVLYRVLYSGTDRMTSADFAERNAYPCDGEMYYVSDQPGSGRTPLNLYVNADTTDHADGNKPARRLQFGGNSRVSLDSIPSKAGYPRSDSKVDAFASRVSLCFPERDTSPVGCLALPAVAPCLQRGVTDPKARNGVSSCAKKANTQPPRCSFSSLGSPYSLPPILG